jgi:KUP system potassium uptake protein
LLLVDLVFFGANLLKIAEGGWIPLSFGLLVFAVMFTWHYGMGAIHRRNAAWSEPPAQFLHRLAEENVVRVPGTGVFLTRLGKGMPPIIVNYVEHTHSLFETVVALTVSFEAVPRVRPRDRISIVNLGEGIWHVTVHFGFIEIPNLPSVIAQAKHEGLPAWEKATYYVERIDAVSRAKRRGISKLRVTLFTFMSRNSVHAVDRFQIPTRELIEIGRRVEL